MLIKIILKGIVKRSDFNICFLELVVFFSMWILVGSILNIKGCYILFD